MATNKQPKRIKKQNSTASKPKTTVSVLEQTDIAKKNIKKKWKYEIGVTKKHFQTYKHSTSLMFQSKHTTIWKSWEKFHKKKEWKKIEYMKTNTYKNWRMFALKYFICPLMLQLMALLFSHEWIFHVCEYEKLKKKKIEKMSHHMKFTTFGIIMSPVVTFHAFSSFGMISTLCSVQCQWKGVLWNICSFEFIMLKRICFWFRVWNGVDPGGREVHKCNFTCFWTLFIIKWNGIFQMINNETIGVFKAYRCHCLNKFATFHLISFTKIDNPWNEWMNRK